MRSGRNRLHCGGTLPFTIPLAWSDAAAIVIFGGTLVFVTALASRELSVALVLVVMAISTNALLIGRAALSILPELSSALRSSGEILVGVAILSLLILFTSVLLGVTADEAFLGSCGLGLAALVYTSRRQRDPTWKIQELVMLLGISAISVVWTWQAIEGVPELQATGRLPVWSDYIWQAGKISLFSRLPTFGARDFVFYHYTSLMLPAAVHSLCRVSALVAATAFWTTLGYVLMGLGGYALGVVLAGRRGGFAAVAALLLVPDAAHYGFRNAFFDFHWFEQISTGGSYATGLACTALALGILAHRHQSGRAFWLGAGVSLLVLSFRPHVFLPLFIAEVLLIAVYWPPARRQDFVATMAALTLFTAAGVLVAQSLPRAPHLLTGTSDPMGFVRWALLQGPSIYADGFSWLVDTLPWPIALALGLAYVLLAAAGAASIGYVVGWRWCGQHGLLLAERWFPVASIAAFLVVIVLVPTNEVGGPYNLIYSQFVLLYAVLAVWSASFVATAVTKYLPTHANAVIVAASCALIPVPFVLSATAQSSMLRWAGPFVDNKVPQDIVGGAAFLHTHVDPRQVVMMATNFHCGPLLALSQGNLLFAGPCKRPVELSDTTLPELPPVAGSAQERVLNCGNYATFRKLAREVGIDWFFVHSTAPPPPWIAESAAWHSGTVFILAADREAE